MYLSRVEIDKDNRRKIKDLTHLGAYHSWVEDSFPEEKEQKSRSRKLWRIDHLNGKTYLLVVSEEKPDLARLEKYGVEGSAQSKKYDDFLEHLQSGRTYYFRATLNPVHSVHEEPGERRGRVYPEVTVEHQMAYLGRKAAKNGFELVPDTTRITERSYEVLKKNGQKPVRLNHVSYEGQLVVKDAEVFRQALISGIGRKKAYGFGLMTVIPEEK